MKSALNKEKKEANLLQSQVNSLTKNLQASKQFYNDSERKFAETLLHSFDPDQIENSFNEYVQAENYTLKNIMSACKYCEKFQNCNENIQWPYFLTQNIQLTPLLSILSFQEDDQESQIDECITKILIKKLLGDCNQDVIKICVNHNEVSEKIQ